MLMPVLLFSSLCFILLLFFLSSSPSPSFSLSLSLSFSFSYSFSSLPLILILFLFLFCLYFLYDFFFETIQKNRSFRQERGGWKADKIRGLRPFAYWHSQAVPSDAGVTQECNVLCLGLVKVLQLLRQVM